MTGRDGGDGDPALTQAGLTQVALTRAALTRAALANLSADAAADLAWETASHPAQRAPARAPDGGDWRTWVFLGGRGAGKTRAGAEWISSVAARLGTGGRVALIGATMGDVREVMVEGPSGLMALPWRARPVVQPSRRRVVFPGGAIGIMLSAAEPERLRGPQFHAAWGDEFCAWARPEEVLAMIRLGLRLPGGDALVAQAASDRVASGSAPRLMLTSTPKPVRALRTVLGEAGCARTDAPTRANAGNLSPAFLEGIEALYGGTRRAAQELEGQILEMEGALFGHAEMARARRLGSSSPKGGSPGIPGSSSPKGGSSYERLVVAVDPAAGTLSGEGGDACGIVAVARADGMAWVLADRTARGLSPARWGARVAALAQEMAATHRCPVRVVAEANQGGAMVESVLISAGLSHPVRRVHARWGKRARAEPVAALYEQGRVAHVAAVPELEEELMALGADGEGGASPDRADALVWAVTDLLIDHPGGEGPRLRQL